MATACKAYLISSSISPAEPRLFDKDHFVTCGLSEARLSWVSPEGFLLNSGDTQGGCRGFSILLWCPLPIFGTVAFSLGHGFSRAVQWGDEVWRIQNKCTHFPG